MEFYTTKEEAMRHAKKMQGHVISPRLVVMNSAPTRRQREDATAAAYQAWGVAFIIVTFAVVLPLLWGMASGEQMARALIAAGE